jgi:hypothetical protein
LATLLLAAAADVRMYRVMYAQDSVTQSPFMDEPTISASGSFVLNNIDKFGC